MKSIYKAIQKLEKHKIVTMMYTFLNNIKNFINIYLNFQIDDESYINHMLNVAK